MSQEIHDQSDGAKQPESKMIPILDDESIDLRAVWSSLRSKRRTILATGAACAILATVMGFLIPTYYTATASFITPRSSNTGLSAASLQLGMGGLGGLTGGALRSPGDMYIGLLQSDTVARNIISRFDLLRTYHVKKESTAEKMLGQQSIFEPGSRDDIIRISVTDHDPKRARDMANAYLDELRSTIKRLALTEASQRRLFFEQQMSQEKDVLENAEVDLKKTQEQSGLIAPSQQTMVEVQTVAATRAQIAGREVELAGLLQGSTNQDPAVIRLRSEVADLRGQLSRMEHGSGSDASSIPTSKVPSLQLDYIRKQREVSYHETLFEILAKQYEAARLDESHDAPMLQVVDEATIPDTKSGPHRSWFLLGGLLAGTLLSAIWVLFRARHTFLRSLTT